MDYSSKINQSNSDHCDWHLLIRLRQFQGQLTQIPGGRRFRELGWLTSACLSPFLAVGRPCPLGFLPARGKLGVNAAAPDGSRGTGSTRED